MRHARAYVLALAPARLGAAALLLLFFGHLRWGSRDGMKSVG
jgi:hypothetical protein